MPETQDKNDDIIALIKEYVSTRAELAKLSAIDRLVVISAGFITDSFVILMLVLTFLFGSITLGFYLSGLLHSYAQGFGLVTLLYLLLGLIVYFTKNKYVEKHLHNFMVKRIFKEKQ